MTSNLVILLGMLFLLMLGMGATLQLKDFKAVLSRPKAFLIGLASQFLWMPLLAFTLGKLLGLSPSVALGLLVLGCTPGGTTSNLFSYLAKGDLALSISMTAVSTSFTFFMMPLLIWFYTKGMDATALAVPYTRIIFAVAWVLVPVAIGVWCRSVSEKWAKRLEKIGSGMGIAVLALLIGTWIPQNEALLSTTGWKIYMAATLQVGVGFVLGYFFSRMWGLAKKQATTVSLETGVQNTTLTLSVLMLSFPGNAEILSVPLIFAFLVIFAAILAVLFFRKMDSRSLSKSFQEATQS